MATFGNLSSWNPALQAKARRLQTAAEAWRRKTDAAPAIECFLTVDCTPPCQVPIERREHHAIHVHVLLRREGVDPDAR